MVLKSLLLLDEIWLVCLVYHRPCLGYQAEGRHVIGLTPPVDLGILAREKRRKVQCQRIRS